MTDLKDFVFADPYKKKAYAHCTHLQIAQADPQSKICKRVQPFLLLDYTYLKRKNVNSNLYVLNNYSIFVSHGF